jgi:RluA family pseudouridine synthase
MFMAQPVLPTSCPVLWSDEHLIVIDKPPGTLSHPNPGPASAPSAFQGTYDEAARRFDGPAGPVWLIHRIDQDTSGCLLAARDESTSTALRAAFEAGKVGKSYHALVSGPTRPQGDWKDALGFARGRGKVRTSVVPGAPINAELQFRALRQQPALRLSFIEIELVTGRTHQIRVQAASRGHPVLGDDVYGDFALNRWAKKELGLKRLFLHASRLTFSHPVTGKSLRITAPLPEILQAVLAKSGLA